MQIEITPMFITAMTHSLSSMTTSIKSLESSSHYADQSSVGEAVRQSVEEKRQCSDLISGILKRYEDSKDVHNN